MPQLCMVGVCVCVCGGGTQFVHGRSRMTIVIRLSLGKLLVNLLQVVKRTNTPLSP